MDVKLEQPNWSDLPSNLVSGIMDKLSLVDDYVRLGAVCHRWHAVFIEENLSNTQKHCSLPFLLVPYFHQENMKKRKSQLGLRACQNNKKKPEGNQQKKRKSQLGLRACPNNKKKYEGSEQSILKPTKEELDADGNPKPKGKRSVYSVARKMVYKRFQVRVDRNKICRGSSFGWLVTLIKEVHENTKLKYYVQLQNPFLPDQTIIHLPTLPIHETDEQIKPYGGEDEDEEEEDEDEDEGGAPPVCELKVWDYLFTSLYLQKAVLSDQPDNRDNENFVVMAILTEFSCLAFFDPAEKTSFCWTPVGDWNKDCEFDDVIFFNKTQDFIAVNKDGAVFLVDVKENTPEEGGGDTFFLEQIAPPLLPNGPFMFAKRYIVELPSGDLLQVISFKIIDDDAVPINGKHVVTPKFQIFRLDTTMGKWIQTYDLGDTILFLGINASISRSTTDFPECKPNCIYFVDDKAYNGFYDTCKYLLPHEMGIYNLEDGTLQPHFSLGSTTFVPQANLPIWLEPTLRH